MKHLFIFLLTIVYLTTFGQKNPIMGSRDTINGYFATGGKIDSIDIAFAHHSSTLPGGGFATTANTQPYNLFLLNEGGGMFRNFSPWKKMRFSGLPHLGFGYVFGTQATQNVKVNYTHAFNENNLLNIDYDMKKGNNFMRNGDFAHNDVQLQFQHTSNFYSMDFKGQYLGRSINHNDGVLSDSLISTVGLPLTPIHKENAISKFKNTRVDLSHYFDILSKDTTNATGFYIDNQLDIRNRRYSEFSDTLAALYSNVYINTDSTFDQSQLSQIRNGGGIFYNRQGFYLKAGVLHNFWRYANLGTLIATNELNAEAKLGILLKTIFLENHTNINFIGAKGEWFTNTKIKFNYKSFAVNAHANIGMQLPEQYQRSYYGNNIYYSIPFDELKQQFRMDIAGAITYTKGIHSAGATIKNATMTNNYWFSNNTWSNDSLTTLNALSIGVNGSTGYKVLRFSASASYNASNWMPDFLAQGRLYLQGKLFKGKKLLGQIGVESSFHTGYQLLNYLPYMDVFTMSTNTTRSMVNLHVFGAFEITRFRFFFRVENLGTMWTDKTTRIAENIVIPPLQIRVGLTWDFFN